MEQGDSFSGDQPDRQGNEGENQHHDQGQDGVQCGGDDDAAYQQNGRTNAHAQAHAHEMMEVVGVGGQSRFQAGNRKGIQLTGAQRQHACKQSVADLFGGLSGNFCRLAVCDDVPRKRQGGADQHGNAPQDDTGYAFLGDDVV